MTKLRQQMDDDMLARGRADRTRESYWEAGSDYGIDLFAHDARRLGASEDAIFETLAVVHRFAGLTKFATSLNLEPDRVPEF